MDHREKRFKKPNNKNYSPLFSGMMSDVSSIVEPSESIENFDQEDELDEDIKNFPELCSAIECDEFAKVREL